MHIIILLEALCIGWIFWEADAEAELGVLEVYWRVEPMKEQRVRKGVWKRKLLDCDFGEKAGLREPQTTVQIQQSLGQPNGELQRKGCLLQKSCMRQKWPGAGAPTVLVIGWQLPGRPLLESWGGVLKAPTAGDCQLRGIKAGFLLKGVLSSTFMTIAAFKG